MEKIKRIADYYGYESQARKATEELSELIRALSRDNYNNIVEELADSMIMIMQLEYLLDCTDAVYSTIEKKVERQLERIRKECVDCSWRMP